MISNIQFCVENIKDNDCFICAFGYEKRSYFIFDKVKEKINKANMLVFCFQECDKKYLNEIIDKKIQYVNADYAQYELIIKHLNDFISLRKNEVDAITLYIDYSSMPRTWYCNIKEILNEKFDNKDRAFFCYTEGNYPVEYDAYPTAGIDSFIVFKGRASLNPRKRIHIIAMGYDFVRSQAITDIIDPEKFIAIIACDSKQERIEKNCRALNAQLLKRAIQIVTLHIDDFEFMVSKLCEMINEFKMIGDVVLVPDGPKPLILAMSMVFDCVGENGVSCLHILRNKKYYSPIDVAPANNIVSFCYKK